MQEYKDINYILYYIKLYIILRIKFKLKYFKFICQH